MQTHLPILFLKSCLITGVTLGALAACSDSTDGNADPYAAAGSRSDSGAPYAGTSARAGSAGNPASKPPSSGGGSGSGANQAPEGGATDVDAGGIDGMAEAGAGGEAACVPEPPTLPMNVPDKIAAPDGTNLLRHFHAVGTQNYRCTAIPGEQGADPAYTWAFIGPQAAMLNSCGVKVGTHFAAPDTDPPAPEWQYDVDGSSVIGAKVDASPVEGAIAELLLKQTGHGGNGVFSEVNFVQRLSTVGGASPDAASCNVDHVDDEQDVGYTAEYYFYSGGT